MLHDFHLGTVSTDSHIASDLISPGISWAAGCNFFQVSKQDVYFSSRWDYKSRVLISLCTVGPFTVSSLSYDRSRYVDLYHLLTMVLFLYSNPTDRWLTCFWCVWKFFCVWSRLILLSLHFLKLWCCSSLQCNSFVWQNLSLVIKE